MSPNKLIVSGNAAATANNILASEGLSASASYPNWFARPNLSSWSGFFTDYSVQ
jgi:hypothetical protein